MRGSKLVLACNCLFLDLGLPSICLVQLFPGGSIIFVLTEVLPDFISLGETIRRQHGISRNEEEGVCRYEVSRSLGLFLRILKRVDVFRDALRVEMVVLRLVLKFQHIMVFDDTA